MVTIGDTTLPGVQTTVESDRSFAVSGGSPGTPGLVGEADLVNGSATAGTVYRITTPVEARNRFGDSLLGNSVGDALQAGAYPVYAVATPEATATDDLSGVSSTSGTLANAPVSDESSDTSFIIDGNPKTTIVTLDDPYTKNPGTDEVYVNHVTSDYELDTVPGDTDSTNDTVEYTYYDYATGIQNLGSEEGDEIDFMFCLTEESASVDALEAEVDRLESEYGFALGVGGAGLNVDPANYANPYDNSRMQLLYPTRTDEGHSILGAYAGLRSAIGIEASVMRKRLRKVDTARRTLTKSEKEDLDAENVVPVENRSPGVRIRTDATSVLDSNSAEASMRDGLSRLIVDYVTEITHDVSDDFIGSLHTQDNRNSMRSMISNRLSELVESNAIIAFTVTVQEVDAYTAEVNVSVETVKPLRNVIANVTAGEVE